VLSVIGVVVDGGVLVNPLEGEERWEEEEGGGDKGGKKRLCLYISSYLRQRLISW